MKDASRRTMVRALLVVLACCPATVAAQGPPSVTLSASGRVLVRRTLTSAIAAGSSTTTIGLGEFMPATLASLDAGVRVVGVRADGAVDEETLLRRNVGHTFEIQTSDTSRRRATLLSMDPERWQWADRPGVFFGRPGRILWPAELVPSAPTADISWQSDHARDRVRVMYQTAGASWAASYQLFLGAAGHLDGTALISSGTLDLADAEVQLLSGDIGRGQSPEAMYKAMPAAAPRMQIASNSFEEASITTNEAVGETHLYTLPHRLSFASGATFTSALFEPLPARADRRFIMPGALQFYGQLNQDPSDRQVAVSVVYHLDRKLGTPLGDAALPGGFVSIYDLDRGGRMQLVGQGTIGHTAPGAELFVDAGTAFDVTGVRTQTDYITSRTTATVGVPSRTTATSSYRVVLHNAKDSAVTVEVREDHAGEWSVLQSSLPAVKKSATRTVFTVPVPARDSAIVSYRVRVVW